MGRQLGRQSPWDARTQEDGIALQCIAKPQRRKVLGIRSMVVSANWASGI